MSEKAKTAESTRSWQKRLLPLMTWMLIGLTIFFFLASFFQLYYLHSRIENGPELDLSRVFEARDSNSQSPDSRENELQIIQWKTLAALDEHTLKQRYHQANVLLMGRIWTRYLCFVTGMILCLVGASFILGKIEQSDTTLGGKNELVDFSIKTSSPGLVLSVLGTILMITSVLVHNDIKVTDGPAYLHLKFLTGSTNIQEKPLPLMLKSSDDRAGEKETTPVPEDKNQAMENVRQKFLERLKSRQDSIQKEPDSGGKP